MKIQWKFADGTESEVEVDEGLSEVILEIEHKEQLNDRKNTRRHLSMNAKRFKTDGDGEAEGFDHADPIVDLLSDLIDTEESELLRTAVAELPLRQRSVVERHFWGELTIAEIAAADGTSLVAAYKSLNKGIDNLKKYFHAGG